MAGALFCLFAQEGRPMIPAPRPYLVLAMRPDRDALSLEWPNAFGARWCSRVLKSQGWAVTVLRGFSPASCADRLYRMKMPIVDRPFDPLYS